MTRGPKIFRATRAALLFLLPVLSIPSAGCDRPPPNFVVIVVDSLRSNQFADLEQDIIRSSRIEGLERRGIRFGSAYASSSWTLPSVVSLLVSQSPSRHSVTGWGSKLSEESLTLPEVLKAENYATGVWTANILLGKETGFWQGIDTYVFAPGPDFKPGATKGQLIYWAPASELSSRVLSWLREQDKKESEAPFFIYLHYMDVHTPYPCPPDRHADCPAVGRDLNTRLTRQNWTFSAEEVKTINKLYEAGVESVAAALGRLMEEMAKGGWLKNTWVVITADHGEMLGEHGQFLHGLTLFEPVTHVPMLFIGPGRGDSVVAQPTSLIDIAPTILDLAGIRKPESFDGRSLMDALLRGRLESQPVVTELFEVNPNSKYPWRHRLGVINGTTKILMGRDGAAMQFNLERDPDEKHPSPISHADLIEGIKPVASLVNLGLHPDLEIEELSPEALEELRALGYVQ